MTDRLDRVPMPFRPILERGIAAVPELVRRTIQPRFLCGVSPRFVGLHYCTGAQLEAAYGAQLDVYEFNPHACRTNNSANGRQTIVLPRLDWPGDLVATVVHEYAHLYDEATGYQLDPPETTPYSRVNRSERVAEALQMLAFPQSALWDDYLRSEPFRPFREAVGL